MDVNPGTVIAIIVAIFITIIVVWLFRYRFFNPLTGYGTYGKPITTSCTNKSGSCADVGTYLSITPCIPNPVTGLGCLVDADTSLLGGPPTVSFAEQITQVPCTVSCRASMWHVERTTPCLYAAGDAAQPCLSSNVRGVSTITQTCVPLDSTGPNTCALPYDPTSTAPLPIGCTTTGGLTTCTIGTTVTLTNPCDVAVPKPICGTWLPLGTCGSTGPPAPRIDCRDVTGVPYAGGTDIFKIGYTTVPLKCSTDVCLPHPTCVSGTIADVNSPVTQQIICSDTHIHNVPGCVEPCFYYPADVTSQYDTSLSPALRQLHGLLWLCTAGSRVLTLHHIPCPADSSASFLPELCTGSAMPLTDNVPRRFRSYGLPTQVVWLDTAEALANPEIYKLPSSCATMDVAWQSGLLLAFRPLAVGVGTLRCTIMALLDGLTVGMLVATSVDSDGSLMWQAMPTTLQGSDVPPVTGSTFIVTYAMNRFSIRLEGAAALSIPSIIKGRLSGTASLDGVTLTSAGSTGPQLHQVLNDKATRRNPQSCNAFYTHTVSPRGYPNPDVGVDGATAIG